MKEKNWNSNKDQNTSVIVVNISSQQLNVWGISAKRESQRLHNDQASSILKYGNFSGGDGLEDTKGQADELRLKTREALEMAKPPKLNISREERFAIRTLKSDSSIIMRPYDNGNASMVMENLEYSHKLASLVGYGS